MSVTPFHRFEYIAYAKSHFGTARFPLALSGVPEVSLAGLRELGATGDLAETHAEIRDAARARTDLLAARYRVPGTQIAPALGTSGAVFQVLAALSTLHPSIRTVAVESPGYETFEASARFLGLDVVRFPRARAAGYALDPDAVDDAFAAGAMIACVTDLHNPTGVALTTDQVEALHQVAERHDAWVLLDEVYRDFRPADVGTAYRPGGRVVTVSSLAKCYGVAGPRVGWAFAPEPLVARMEEITEVTYGTEPSPSVALAATALQVADGLLARTRRIVRRARKVMDAWVAAEERVSWVPPDGGFTGLLHVRGLTDSKGFASRLREELDVQVAPGAFFDADDGIRVSFGLPPARLQQALEVLSLGLGALLP